MLLFALAATAPRWFCPLTEFSLDEPRPPADTLPLLLVLPGLDGSGITAFTQYPELSLEYELKVLTIAADDRSSFASLVELVDPPRRRRAEADRDDAAAPGPGLSLAETPLNCSSIEGVTGNMPGVELFYERASRQVERSQKRKLFLRYFLFFFYAYALRTPSLTATPAPQSPSSAASSPWSCPAACSTR